MNNLSRYEYGFTLLELVFAFSVIGILAAISLPFYNNYLDRAYLADVLVQYDAMRTKALVRANESGKNLCDWEIQNVGNNIDDDTKTIEKIVEDGLNQLDPVRWSRSTSGLRSATGSNQKSALVVQFGGISVAGVRQNKLLATMFQKNDLFHEWQQQTAVLSAFTVFLNHCTPPTSSTVVTAATIMPPGSQQQPLPPVNTNTGTTTNPVITPPLVSSTVNTQTPVVTTQTVTMPTVSTSTHVVSQVQQIQQCLDNCRVIYPHGNSIHYRRCTDSCY